MQLEFPFMLLVQPKADKDEHRLYLAITFHFDSIENSNF